MGRNSGVRTSSLLKLSVPFNEVILFDFDLTCAARLKMDDDEREARLLEAASGGLLARLINGTPQAHPEQKKKMREGSF